MSFLGCHAGERKQENALPFRRIYQHYQQRHQENHFNTYSFNPGKSFCLTLFSIGDGEHFRDGEKWDT